jgi:hypothetical protein
MSAHDGCARLGSREGRIGEPGRAFPGKSALDLFSVTIDRRPRPHCDDDDLVLQWTSCGQASI